MLIYICKYVFHVICNDLCGAHFGITHLQPEINQKHLKLSVRCRVSPPGGSAAQRAKWMQVLADGLMTRKSFK